MPENNTSRRTVLKSIAAGSAAASVSALGTVGTVSADDHRIEAEEDELPYPDVDYKTVGDDVWEALGPQYWLATIDRDRIGELLELSPVGSEEARLRAEMVDEVRATYEIEQERDGNELTYRLVDGSVDPLGKERRAALSKVAGSAFDGLAAESENDVEPQWNPGDHERQVRSAAEDFDIFSYKVDDIAEAAREPDDFGCEDCSADWLPGAGYVPGFLKDALENAIDDLDPDKKQPPYQFYWPDPPSLDIWQWEIGPSAFGGAPQEGQYMMDNAADTYNSREYIGYAVHYLQDMGVPLHTGAIWEQVNPSPDGCGVTGCDQYLDPRFQLHYGYEGFIYDNFPEDEEASYLDKSFEESFDSASFPYYIDSVEAECKDLANTTTQYSTSIFEELMAHGTDYPSLWDDTVYQQTHNCLQSTGGYVRGLLDEFYDFNY